METFAVHEELSERFIGADEVNLGKRQTGARKPGRSRQCRCRCPMAPSARGRTIALSSACWRGTPHFNSLCYGSFFKKKNTYFY